jgi:hypothetical protein
VGVRVVDGGYGLEGGPGAGCWRAVHMWDMVTGQVGGRGRSCVVVE